jgi:hypothetical protein
MVEHNDATPRLKTIRFARSLIAGVLSEIHPRVTVPTTR